MMRQKDAQPQAKRVERRRAKLAAETAGKVGSPGSKVEQTQQQVKLIQAQNFGSGKNELIQTF
jgi:hypothetical protein